MTPEASAQIHKKLNQWYPEDKPGCCALVMCNGKVVFERGYGLADIEFQAPCQPQTVFRIASITKQFTAVSILKLVEQGKCALKDPIANLLPVAKNMDPAITVAHLLNHTSGVAEHTTDELWQTRQLQRKPEDLARLFVGKPLVFAPGARHEYCNSNYILLGMLIEQLSGQPYAEFIKSSICEPLGLQHTQYDKEGLVIPNRAQGYDHSGTRHAPYISMTMPYAAGGLVSTVGDLAKWHSALLAGEVIPNDLLKQAWQANVLNTGKDSHYGFGWQMGEIEGSQLVCHGGSIPGFTTFAGYFPKTDTYFVLLKNAETIPAEIHATIIGKIAMGEPIKVPLPINLDADVLSELVGDYQYPDGFISHITLEQGKLNVQPGEFTKTALKPYAQDKFLYPDEIHHLEFTRNNDGMVTGHTVFNFKDKWEIATKIPTN